MKRELTYRNRIGLAASLMGLAFAVAVGAGALSAVGQVGGGGPTTAPAAAPVAIHWMIDSVEAIGGIKPQVLGAPKVVGLTGAIGDHAATVPATIQYRVADEKDLAVGYGHSVSFDGKADGLILPVVPLAGMKTFTIEVLFRPESGGPTEQRFMHSEDEGGNRMTIETRLTADGKWALETFLLTGAGGAGGGGGRGAGAPRGAATQGAGTQAAGGAGGGRGAGGAGRGAGGGGRGGGARGSLALLDQTKLHPADQWYWVALRYDGTNETSYINGEKELEGALTFPGMGEKGRISLGVRLNLVNWFKGQIKEVRITPRALEAGELQKVK